MLPYRHSICVFMRDVYATRYTARVRDFLILHAAPALRRVHFFARMLFRLRVFRQLSCLSTYTAYAIARHHHCRSTIFATPR